MTGIQDTSNRTLRQLLGNGLTYEVPKFQRDYSWEMEQWDDLWQDIQVFLSKEGAAHYMGYLVLQTTNNKNFKVIDGQQRMITLSILILAVIKALNELVEKDIEADKNKARIDSFRSSYIGYLDPVTLISSNKLKLNRNNDDFYRQKLVPLVKLPTRDINASEKLMKSCFNWYFENLRIHSSGEALASFVDKIVDKLFFTTITVSDELNAFRVFETLNARGVQLSSADMLKNYLFSVVDANQPHVSEINEVESLWGFIIGKLGSEKFPEFLRVFWNSKNKTVRKADLFKAIRKSIATKAQVFQLLRQLEASADIYIALRNPNDETWKGEQKIVSHLQELKIFQVRQPFSLLLTAYEQLDLDGFRKVLKACSVLSFRYNVIGGLNPNEQEKVYNEVALNMQKNKVFDSKMLENINPQDDSFETEFSNKSFKRTSRNHKIVKYIFAKMERHLYHSDIDLFSDLYSIEHILPESPDAGWEQFSDDALDRCVYRLGNLTILEKKLNKKTGTLSFQEKAPYYKSSSLEITLAIPKHYGEWTEDSINQRQRQLAKKAKEIWQF